MSACNAANYQYYGNWQTLSREERAALIAHYFVLKTIDNVVSDVQAQEMERKSKKRGKR